jgi:nitronate monooxygenase
MWSQNVITEKLNIEWPILQAPMAEFTTPALAAAVSNAGGMGALGMWGYSAEEVIDRISGFRELSDGGLNVNYPLWDEPKDFTGVATPMRDCIQRLYHETGLGPIPVASAAASAVNPDHLEALVDMKPEVVSFHFGLPHQKTIDALKAANIFIMCSATTVAESTYLEANGVDFIIAQGTEAGGHRGTFSGVDIGMQSGLFSLLPQIVDAVNVPVIAAGGISDGRAIAAAVMLGASGVLLGTAFLRCEEANVPAAHRAALSDAQEASTTITDLISGRNARFISNRLVEELTRSGAEPLPFPAQYNWTLPLGETGDRDFTELLCGQSVALTREMPAADLVRTLAAETNRCLQSCS